MAAFPLRRGVLLSKKAFQGLFKRGRLFPVQKAFQVEDWELFQKAFQWDDWEIA